MSVYQVQVKKRLQRHSWTNSYTIVVQTPFSRGELEKIADEIAPKLVAFESVFYSEEVELGETETKPICDPPEEWIALRYRPVQSGLRPFAIEDSAGPAITLLLSLQPVANHWGNKDYRYALRQDEIQAVPGGYQLRPDSRKAMEHRLTTAKNYITFLLVNDISTPRLAVSASKQAHRLEEYKYRRVQNITLKGIHINKHRR